MEMNNHAWTLAEKPDPTPAEEEEMLHAAHASALHWSRVGGESNRARADMLLGQVHALLGHGALALRYARRSHEYILAHASPGWEIAFSHAVLANAAHAAHEVSLYEAEYSLAKRLGADITDAGEKEIFGRTFARLPAPKGESGRNDIRAASD